MKRPLHPAATLLAAALFGTVACSDGTGSGPVFVEFSDDFNDGVIDAAHWTAAGAITEAAGVLRLRRQSPDDSIKTVNSFSGDWTIELEIRLNSIGWNDMYHGISIRNEAGFGVSFGFTQHGKLYRAHHEPVGGGTRTQFDYGPDGSNAVGQWQRWTIQNVGGTVTIRVNGAQLTGVRSATVPGALRVSLPGYYTDGDGGAHVGVTSSDVQSFSITTP